MPMKCSFIRRLGVLLTACSLASVLASTSASAQTLSDSQPTLEDIAVRDSLIASQESLLNTYRCRFNIDTHAVPGGCTGGQPASGRTPPGKFEGSPSRQDIAVRDSLIASQESLLNTYRCRFNIDTHIVPSGCQAPPAPKPGQTDQTAPEATHLPIPANPPSRIAVGSYHFCHLRADKTAVCMGDADFYGQSLTGAPPGPFASISSGERHACGIRENGAVQCWGDDQFGPFPAPDGQFVVLSGGGGYSCGLRPNGTIECWDFRDAFSEPVGDDWWLEVPDGTFVAVSANLNLACGLRANGVIQCWGDEGNRVAQSVPNGRFSAISVGGDHACGIRDDGSLQCWGDIDFAPDGRFTAVVTGYQHACGLRSNGTVECARYGRNEYGQANPPNDQFTEIAAGGFHTCGLRTDQAAVCWGGIKRPFVGNVEIPVFYCASISASYTQVDLQREVRELNSSTGQFFRDQSSGLANLNFTAGGIVSPDIQWVQHTVGGLAIGSPLGEPCETAVRDLGDYPQSLILVDLAPGFPAGFARIESPVAMAFTATLEGSYTDICGRLGIAVRVRDLADSDACAASVERLYYRTTTHEIGHSALNLDHPNDCSIMSYICQDNTRLGCISLLLLGWSHEEECAREQQQRVEERTDFTVVVRGGTVVPFYCGIRTDQTVLCWGATNWSPIDSSEAFTAISASAKHVCGLRTNRTITCWGQNDHGQLDAPSGTFTSVRTWPSYSCGERDDGAINCWGDWTVGKIKSYTPGGEFTGISAGRLHWCGLRTDRSIACGGFFELEATKAPGGNFITVNAVDDETCGIRDDLAIVCWGTNSLTWINRPASQFNAIGIGFLHTCGLQADQTITCWYHHPESLRLRPGSTSEHVNAPGGQFTAISAGSFHTCGLRSDQTITCWGDNGYGQSNAPAGRFTAVSAGGNSSCGLRADQTIACWGDNSVGQSNAPAGRFTAVSQGGYTVCGVRNSGTVTCWGQNSAGEADAPSGQFLAVSAGGQHSCGLHTDRVTITCWGVVPE